MWEFTAGVLLLTLGGGRSLLLPATLAFAAQMTQALLGAKAGGIVDSGGTLSMPLLSLGAQNIAIGLSAVSAVLALQGSDEVSIGAFSVIFFSCVGRLASLASKVSVENHWAVALGNADDDPQALTRLNGNMRAVDLSCKILAPTAAGLLMSLCDYQFAGCVVALTSFLAWPLEAVCLTRVYNDPWCREQLDGRKLAADNAGENNGLDAGSSGAWRLYFSQSMWPSAFALSMLHLTVLSFGQLMTAYVLTLGVHVALVSLYRSAGEVFGLAATQIKPWLDRRRSGGNQDQIATMFISFQVSMLVPSVIGATVWAREDLGPVAASLLLVGGVGASRFGLWGFDLTVSLMLQNGISPPDAMGRVVGVQKSLEAFFGVIAGVLCILMHDPSQFQILALISWTSVSSAAVLHTASSGIKRLSRR